MRSEALELPRGDGQTVLVVDDDPGVVELVQTTLTLAGYEVVTATAGAQAIRAHATSAPDVVILDVVLPDIDGFTVCRELLSRGSRVPVLFLTARDAVADRVTGLTSGAEDYLTKPFSVPELLARVHVLLRRTGSAGAADQVLRHADLAIDERAKQVRRAGRLAALSPTEYALLRYLVLNAGRVVSKAQIMDHVWQHRFADGVVEKLVSRLRSKVDAQGDARLIHTVRGFGYCLRGDADGERP
ncbi:response regulator transcription factor [Lentzea sp. NPDC059081]|uniref:response regulator transcription factor n=1 Tax=Lentzea sp. NPDC059081 TaxID=3346719 RepID=UPI0036976DD4